MGSFVGKSYGIDCLGDFEPLMKTLSVFKFTALTSSYFRFSNTYW